MLDPRRVVALAWFGVASTALMGCGGRVTGTIGGGDAGSDANRGLDATRLVDTGIEGGGDEAIRFDSAPDGLGIDSPAGCVGLLCVVQRCSGGTPTTVTGYAYAPNGTLPLYNVTVFVPNAPLAPMPLGVTCDNCGTPLSGKPITTALSDATGKFTLTGVPTGANIPLVVQLGKWRRLTYIKVDGCSVNTLTDPNLTRLPAKQSEGSMPHIALTTGGCDQMGCMLPKLGIDPSEFGTQADGYNKAVNVYNGSGGTANGTPAGNLWGDATLLDTYDIGIFSCECSEALETKGNSDSSPDFANVRDFLNAGGRLLTTDFQYTWYKYSPDPGIGGSPAGSDTIGIGEIKGGAPIGADPIMLSTSFPKGSALTDWLKDVFSGKALPSGVTFPLDSYAPMDESDPDVVFANIQSLDSAKTLTWAQSGAGSGGYGDYGGAAGPRVFTMNTPVGVATGMQCGKAVHVDAHVDTSGQTVGSGFPGSGCSSTLAANEGMYAFLLFDVSACVQNDLVAPSPPPPSR